MTDNTQNTQTEPKDTHQMGDYIGYVKWFNDSKGFGFVRIVTQGDRYGEDVFVHQSQLKPARSKYRTLCNNETITFNLSEDERPQAVEVTGVNGLLFCDTSKFFNRNRLRKSNENKSNQHSNDAEGGWKTA